MADKLNNYSIGDNNIDSVMLTLDRTFQNSDKINITGLTDTVLPQVAAGSVIEINGAYFKVTTDETISGSLTIGSSFGYIAATPSGATASFSFTHTAPTFSYTKNGFYGAGALSNSKYLPFIVIRTASSVYEKRYSNFAQYETTYFPKITTDLLNSTGQIDISGTITGDIINATSYDNSTSVNKINAFSIYTNKTTLFSSGNKNFRIFKPCSIALQVTTGPGGGLTLELNYGSSLKATVLRMPSTQYSESTFNAIMLNPGYYTLTTTGATYEFNVAGIYGTDGYDGDFYQIL